MFRNVTKELRFAAALLSSIRNHVARLAVAVELRLNAHLDETSAISVVSLFRALAGELRRQVDLITATEAGLLGHRREMTKTREARDKDRDALYEKVITFRSTFEAAYGPGRSAVFVGLEPGLAAAEAKVLLRNTKMALGVLESPDFEPPEAKLDGAAPEPDKAVAQIRPLYEKLEATVTTLEDHQRQEEEAIRLRDETVDVLHDLNIDGSRILRGFFGVGGEDFHADRLRRASPRSRSSSETPLPDTPPGTAEPPPAGEDPGPTDGPDQAEASVEEAPVAEPQA